MLLDRDPPRWINPQENVLKRTTNTLRLWHQIEFGSLDTPDLFRAQVFYVERFQHIVSAAAKAEHQEALELGPMLACGIHRHLIDARLVNLHFGIGE